MFSYVPDISSAKGAAEDMIRLVDSEPEIDAEATDGKFITEATGHIELRDIHFRYRMSALLFISSQYLNVAPLLATRPGVRVLRGLNITIEPGSYVAIVGASGSG